MLRWKSPLKSERTAGGAQKAKRTDRPSCRSGSRFPRIHRGRQARDAASHIIISWQHGRGRDHSGGIIGGGPPALRRTTSSTLEPDGGRWLPLRPSTVARLGGMSTRTASTSRTGEGRPPPSTGLPAPDVQGDLGALACAASRGGGQRRGEVAQGEPRRSAEKRAGGEERRSGGWRGCGARPWLRGREVWPPSCANAWTAGGVRF